ncbi:ATP-grasp domain-containing protein [bacterium]|nr:ATP-grasp domain-containing protein [bacterium]
MIGTLLIANRGEIARRVIRTCRALGIRTVAVFSDADAGAPHVDEADEAVRIGPAPSLESYLSIDRLLAAAAATGADAVHPGYGFLAENADFAARCAAAGLTFIGPPPEAIRRMGSKVGAREIMAAAGVPVVPGASGAGLDDAALRAAAEGVGFPLLIKASAGGGGKGMRLVREAAALGDALAAARREAQRAFGDDTLLLERYFDAPRHIEVQIFGDAHGRVLHLFERECSIQRRFQKVIEEAPSPVVDAALRARLGEAAVAAGRAIGYVGAGTVEFIVDQRGAFYFLEVNTRLQVEHPVTEAITGLDLVALQIRVAEGEPLPAALDALTIDGHAIEARLYAEAPERDFLPATGRLALWQPPAVPGVRWDSGVERGSLVSVHYDPLLAKVIAHGPTRAVAIDRLIAALRGLAVGGVTTNRDFLLALLAHPELRAGAIDTHFIDRHLPASARAPRRDPQADRIHAIAAAIDGHQRRRRGGESPLPASLPSGWRNNRWRPQDVAFLCAGERLEVQYVAEADGAFTVACGERGGRVLCAAWDPEAIALEIDGVRRRFAVAVDGDAIYLHGPLGGATLVEQPRFPPRAGDELTSGCLAPMPGIVRQVLVKPGDRVEKGTVMVVLEAMKMEHPLTANAPATVTAVRVEVGQMVDPDAVMVVLEALE